MKKIGITLLFILIAATVLFSISKNTMNKNTNQKKIRYVALGDSYTICEGASWEQSWPYILTQHLNEHGIAVELIANPSVTGFTTQDLIDKELSVYDASNPDFATPSTRDRWRECLVPPREQSGARRCPQCSNHPSD